MTNCAMWQEFAPTVPRGNMHYQAFNPRAPSNTSTPLPMNDSQEDPLELSQFASLPPLGPWRSEAIPSTCGGQHPQNLTHTRQDRGLAPPSSPANWRPIPLSVNPERSSGWQPTMSGGDDGRREQETRKRAAGRELQRPYLKEMAQAHAENREPRIEIPVCPSGKVLGLLNPWQRAARLCARQTLNYKVRSYKAKRELWESQVQCIADKLAQNFSYSRPLDIAYLGKFLKNTLKNDRKHWKKYFVATHGLKHPRCPEEAFTEWKKYWLSEAGKEESVQMTEMRKGRNKSLRTDTSAFTSDDSHRIQPPD